MRIQHKDFRKEEVSDIMARMKSSESVSLVGVGSVGKTNLLHHIVYPDTKYYHLSSDHADKIFPVVVDPNLLGAINGESEQFRCWAGYELLMHRMLVNLHPLEMLDSDAENFRKTYVNLQDGTNPLYAYMGLRYFEMALNHFFRRDYKIVFVFDEFEELLRSMPIKFFQTLRGLRDSNKHNLSFVTFSREPIPVLVEKMGLPQLEIEPFSELFTDNIKFIGPYNYEDASRMVHSLMQRNPNLQYSDSAINFLLNATGCFAGILRAGFKSLSLLGDIGPADLNNMNLIERLARRPRIRTECETIWNSLTEIEKQVLVDVANRHQSEITDDVDRAISLLVQKRLLRTNPQVQNLQIKPPVFGLYVNSIV